MENKKTTSCFREAADKVWVMAEEYKEKGYFELATELKNLSTQLHDLARIKELAENGQSGD